MRFCSNCGNEMNPEADVCLNCGKSHLKNQPTHYNDTGGLGWGLLGFCVPMVGLILYLVWLNERPRTAKAAGTGALISVVSGVLFYLFFIILVISL